MGELRGAKLCYVLLNLPTCKKGHKTRDYCFIAKFRYVFRSHFTAKFYSHFMFLIKTCREGVKGAFRCVSFCGRINLQRAQLTQAFLTGLMTL